MIWNKPRNVWWWLALLSPAVLAIGAAQAAKWWLPPIPPLRYQNGLVIANVGWHIGRVSSIALEVITVGSVVIAFIISHGVPLGQRIVNVLGFTLCLFFVNSFVAFAGCALIGVPNPAGSYELAPARADTGDGNNAADGRALPADKLPPPVR